MDLGIAGNLIRDFDFHQQPRRPVLLRPWPDPWFRTHRLRLHARR